MKGTLRVLGTVLGLLAGPALVSPAFAQANWPQKPVRMIVPFPAGGSNDTLCRLLGDKLSGAWKQPVIIDNRTGAGGNIGAEIAYHADPDGYTLLCSPPGPLSINHNLYKSIPYDWSKFVPVTVLAIVPNVITARLDLPANTAQELVALARKNPGKLTFASQGNGSTSHLSAEMFLHQTGTDMVHVPYKGRGPGAGRHRGRPRRHLHRQHRGGPPLPAKQAGEVPGLAAKSRSPVRRMCRTPPRSACPT